METIHTCNCTLDIKKYEHLEMIVLTQVYLLLLSSRGMN